MDKLTEDECAQLMTLSERPRLIASYERYNEKERLNRLIHRGLVNAKVYHQGGTIYFLTRLGERALNEDAAKKPACRADPRPIQRSGMANSHAER